MDQLRWLIAEGIEVHTQIVVTPGVNDGEHLEQSVRDLASLYPGVKSISIVPIGLTKQHKYGLRQNTQAEAQQILDLCEVWQAEYQEMFGARLVYATDEWHLVADREIPTIDQYDGFDLTENGLGQVRRFMNDWEAVKAELGRETKIKSLTLATATLFAPTLQRYADDFSALSNVPTTVVPITNMQLGDSITVAGLLMGADVIAQLQAVELGDVVILPRVMFDHPDGVALDDKSPMDIARALNRPIALVDMMSDLVDVIYGQPALYFHPSGNQFISTQSILKDGGWAVEKYL
jgi:putative radical SAM enzyme (TIGR03279 family)